MNVIISVAQRNMKFKESIKHIRWYFEYFIHEFLIDIKSMGNGLIDFCLGIFSTTGILFMMITLIIAMAFLKKDIWWSIILFILAIAFSISRDMKTGAYIGYAKKKRGIISNTAIRKGIKEFKEGK